MRAVRYVSQGGIDKISVQDVPDPDPPPGHLVVRVRSTCINRGSVAALNGAPFKPTRDLAGEGVAVGEGVRGFAVGDAVLGWFDDSAHAQLVAVPIEQLIPKPAGLPWDVAGSLYVSAMAALASVKAVAPTAGEVVVVSGASGAVGLVAAQLAKHVGARVIGLASTENLDWLKNHGIVAVAYGDGQGERILAAAGNKRPDAFIDTVGAGYVDLALALGLSSERINTVVDFKAAQEKGVKAMGTKQAGGLPALRELANLAESGVIAIPIAEAFPLDQVQNAYRKVADRTTRGKIVLHPQE